MKYPAFVERACALAVGVVALWVVGVGAAYGEGAGRVEATAGDAAPWSLGVSVGHPQLVEISAPWRPIPRLYVGPTLGLTMQAMLRPEASLAYGFRGVSLGAVAGWEWPLGGWHGLMVEASGGAIWHVVGACNGLGAECTPYASWFAGAHVGWYARPDQTTWQVTAGVVYSDGIFPAASEGYQYDPIWMPSLRLVGQFGL